jgi:hypothetical protein
MNYQKSILALALLFLSFAAKSQETAFGIKAGINLPSMNLDDAKATYEARTGYHAGIFLRGKFDKVAIQPELLLFTQKGEGSTSTFSHIENSFTYLSIPVMLKFYPVAGLNLQLGPQFGFLIDGEQKYSNALISGKRDITDAYKSSDVSVSLGAGYDFGFGLGLDARYNVGVKDINNEVNGETAKSRVFLVSLSWNFLK